MALHEKYMLRCIDLASMGLRAAMPNPGVGAVIVHNETIIGEGYTSPYGGAHAEVNAINAVLEKEFLKESTLYVSLEPCSHYGKTPPCTELIIKSGIPKVVIGIRDPFKAVNGSGIEKLQKSGIEVTEGVLEKKCYEVNKRFFTFHKKNRPYIILKWARSADGFMDKKREDSEKGIHWITQPETQILTHQWRADEMAIAIGTNTAIIDNPSLTVRAVNGKNPWRIVLDKDLSLDIKLNIFNKDSNTLILNQIESKINAHLEYVKIDFSNVIPELLKVLKEKNILSVIIEGGNKFLHSFIEANIWDEARIITGDVEFKEGLPAPIIYTTPVTSYLCGKDKVAVYQNDNPSDLLTPINIK